jgi:RimJ/RimL family protein N-acetyltransferase
MIRLDYFEKEDVNLLMNWINSDELLTNWAGSLFSFPLTPSSMEWYISNTNDLNSSDAFIYKVINDETGEVVGHISLGAISRKNRSGRISRVFISDDHKGKGYCRQMIEAILKIGFEDLKLHRISLGVYNFNSAALKCYQSAGFTIEGTTRDVLMYNDKWWSLVEMSILEDEWKK